MAKYVIDDSTLTALADAIRSQTGGAVDLTPAMMIAAIPTLNQLPEFFAGNATGEVIVKGNSYDGNTPGVTINVGQTGSTSEGVNYGVTGITFADMEGASGNQPLQIIGGNRLQYIRLPRARTLAGVKLYYFVSLDSLTEFTAPLLTEIAENLLYNATALPSVSLPSCTRVGPYGFCNCAALSTVDLADDTTSSHQITRYAFQNSGLVSLILRNTKNPWVLSAVSAFTSTPIASGTGYIYVPSAFLSSYKTATNWTTYTDQFRALEDYTTDGTVTGELDASKI